MNDSTQPSNHSNTGTDSPIDDFEGEVPLTRYVLVVFLSQLAIDRALVLRIRRLLDEKISTTKRITEIDLWIESPGGDAHAAYKLALLLRNRCHKLNAVIVDYAKSAATLLVLGASQIFMDAESELGPLDTQIDHPDRENVIISALDIANSFVNLGLQSIQIVLKGGQAILDSTDLPRAEVLRASLRFAARYTHPVVQKLDPSLINRANSKLKVAQHYAEILLNQKNPDQDEHRSHIESSYVAKILVNTYPDHGYVISRDEAKQLLRLPVKDMECYDLFKHARTFYISFIEDENDVVSLFTEPEIRGLFEQPSDPVDLPGETGDNGNQTIQHDEGHHDAGIDGQGEAVGFSEIGGGIPDSTGTELPKGGSEN